MRTPPRDPLIDLLMLLIQRQGGAQGTANVNVNPSTMSNLLSALGSGLDTYFGGGPVGDRRIKALVDAHMAEAFPPPAPIKTRRSGRVSRGGGRQA